jgi:hypothetical protein
MMTGAVTECPKARTDLMLQEVGSEGMLYDRTGERIHILNVTALAIWKVCDGSRDINAIGAAIGLGFSGLEGHDIKSDIEKLLTEFEERGLLVIASARPAI